MKKKLNFFISIFMTLCLFALILSACTAGGRTARVPGAPGTPRQERNIRDVTPENPHYGTINVRDNQNRFLGANPGTDGVNQVNPQVQVTDNRRRAENICSQLSQMKDLSRVNVVVIGNTAIVGFSTTNTVKDVNAAKNLIVNRVKEIDPSITNVAVSESADIMAKLNQLSNDISNNRPTDQVTNDFNRILQSITPTVR